MKIISKIKKLIISVGIAIISFPNRIFAIDISQIQDLYGPPPVSLYGIPNPTNPIRIIWKISKFFVIPLALLIGLIIYFKKSKSTKKKKIFVSAIAIICTIIIILIINNLIYNII